MPHIRDTKANYIVIVYGLYAPPLLNFFNTREAAKSFFDASNGMGKEAYFTKIIEEK